MRYLQKINNKNKRITFVLTLVLSLLLPVVAMAAGTGIGTDVGTTEIFSSGIVLLKNIVVALGAGLLIWGVVNLLEGYGNDNPGAKSQGMKQFAAGAGVAAIGFFLIPKLQNLFTQMGNGA